MLVHSARRLWVIELLCMTATLPTTMVVDVMITIIVRGHLGSSARFACEGRLMPDHAAERGIRLHGRVAEVRGAVRFRTR